MPGDQGFALGGVGQDRHDALFGKVDVLHRRVGLEHHMTEFKGNRLKIGLEEIEVVGREG